MKQLYIIDYENATYCGGQLNVCVWANSATEATLEADSHMQDNQNELFSDEYREGDDSDYDDCAYSVNSVEVFDENHEQWAFFSNPSQESFYPVIGESN